MKKALITAVILSGVMLAGCGTQSDITARLDNIEQRLSTLEGNGTTAPTSTANPANAAAQSTDTADNKVLDVLSFELISTDPSTSTGKAKHTYKVTNNGSAPLSYISVDFAYYDADGNALDTDGRFKDIVIEPGKSVNMDTYGGDETTSPSIASSKATSYYYYLVTPLADGNNKVEVNCETGKVKTSYHEQ